MWISEQAMQETTWQRALALASLEFTALVVIGYLGLVVLFFYKREISVGIVCLFFTSALPAGVLLALVFGWMRAARWGLKAFMAVWTLLVVMACLNFGAAVGLRQMGSSTKQWLFGGGDRFRLRNSSVKTVDTPPRATTDPDDKSEEQVLVDVKAALSRGGSPHDVIEPVYGLTRIHVAARSAHSKVLSYLIEQGGDVNIKNQGGLGAGGETPLHWASTGEVVDLLIAKGADPGAPGAAEQSPLASAASRNRPSAVKALVRHGADVNARDTLFGNSVVMWACTGLTIDYGDPALNRYEDRLLIIEYLVSEGAAVNAQANDGETALHITAKYDARFVGLLLRLGADPTIRDKQGKLAIDCSRMVGLDAPQQFLKGQRSGESLQ